MIALVSIDITFIYHEFNTRFEDYVNGFLGHIDLIYKLAIEGPFSKTTREVKICRLTVKQMMTSCVVFENGPSILSIIITIHSNLVSQMIMKRYGIKSEKYRFIILPLISFPTKMVYIFLKFYVFLDWVQRYRFQIQFYSKFLELLFR